MRISSWIVEQPGLPMAWQSREEEPAPGDVLVEVAGCGVCHTDLGFYYDGVPTRHAVPAHARSRDQRPRRRRPAPARRLGSAGAVVVPAVHAVRRVRGLPRRTRPDLSRSRCSPATTCTAASARTSRARARPVPRARSRRSRASTRRVSTSPRCRSSPMRYRRRIRPSLRSGCRAGDVAVCVGAGGVGGFGVQISAALGAARRRHRRRRRAAGADGAARRRADARTPRTRTSKALRKAGARVRRRARRADVAHRRSSRPRARRRASRLAFGLLGHGSLPVGRRLHAARPSSCACRT